MGVTVRRILFRDVTDVKNRLGRQKLKHVPSFHILGRDRNAPRRAAVFQRRPGLQQKALLLQRLLFAAADLADDVLKPLFDRFQIGQHQFGLDRFCVRDRVDPAVDMGDIIIFEAAQDMSDGIDLADVGQELVAEALAPGCAFHQTGDINEGHPRRYRPFRFGDGGQFFEPGIRDRDLTDVGLDRAERKVRRLRGGRPRKRVEQCRFSDIGQPDNTGSEAHLGCS